MLNVDPVTGVMPESVCEITLKLVMFGINTSYVYFIAGIIRDVTSPVIRNILLNLKNVFFRRNNIYMVRNMVMHIPDFIMYKITAFSI